MVEFYNQARLDPQKALWKVLLIPFGHLFIEEFFFLSMT